MLAQDASAIILGRFHGLDVLVVGEAMLDVYVEGTVSRICREAPVPVLNVDGEVARPGGAANAAVNAASLGASVSLVSVAGDDSEAERLAELLGSHGLTGDGIVRDPARSTLAKRRFLAGGQMLLRVDEGSTGPISPEMKGRLIATLRERFAAADAVIVSDYAYGVMTPAIIAELARLQRTAPRPMVLDARFPGLYRDVGASIAKPNRAESCGLLGMPPKSAVDAIALEAHRLLEIAGTAAAAVTLDCDGVVLVERGRDPVHFVAAPAAHPEVTGAGIRSSPRLRWVSARASRRPRLSKSRPRLQRWS